MVQSARSADSPTTPGRAARQSAPLLALTLRRTGHARGYNSRGTRNRTRSTGHERRTDRDRRRAEATRPLQERELRPEGDDPGEEVERPAARAEGRGRRLRRGGREEA